MYDFVFNGVLYSIIQEIAKFEKVLGEILLSVNINMTPSAWSGRRRLTTMVTKPSLLRRKWGQDTKV